MTTMMLVSSDPSLIEAVGEVVGSLDGFDLEVVAEVEHACALIGRDDLLIVLYHLGEGSCVTGVTRLLQTIAIKKPSVITLVLGEEHRAEQGLALLHLGVADYLSRPLDANRLAYLIDILTLSARHGQPRAVKPAAEAPSVASFPGVDGQFFYVSSEQMGRMIEQVRRIAPLDTTILLGGETGTGKTRLAGVIHQLSPRRDRPFLVINCGALSASLIESEMFGHVRGAFTGAEAERTGKFAEAGRGTLFLDEIDSLPLSLQSKLLRAVEERVFEPVGSNRTQSMQARLIVASNQPLEREVSAGRFRADLFYRLNVIAFEIPPLRERASIIPAIANEFLGEFAARSGRRAPLIAPDALSAMIHYPWPGNIRELRNVVERAFVLSEGPVIRLDDLPVPLHRHAAASPSLPPPPSPPRTDPGRVVASNSLASSKAQAESGRITEALDRNGGNRLRAAAELGISRWTLYKKLHKYGLT